MKFQVDITNTLRDMTWLKFSMEIANGIDSKFMKDWVLVQSTILNEIYPSMKFEVVIFMLLGYALDKILSMKITKGNNSRIMVRVTVLVQCTPTQRDLSTYLVYTL